MAARPRIRTIAQLGNPVLRCPARRLVSEEIQSDDIQGLIADIRYTNMVKKYGVGLAAPQVGVGVALSVIGIKPTPTRLDLDEFEQVIINPAYEGIGRRRGMWEGCQSCGQGVHTLYGKALRWKRIQASWYDEHGVAHDEILDGFVAHVFQHETDHLNGVIFLDRVRDTSTFMMADEFRKRVVGR